MLVNVDTLLGILPKDRPAANGAASSVSATVNTTITIHMIKTKISINPDLPPDFFCTPNEERSQKEMLTWWRIPFVLSDECSSTETRYNVRRLDGGAWDRPTNYGVFDTLDEAIEVAERLFPE